MSSTATLPPLKQNSRREGRQQLPGLREVFGLTFGNYLSAAAQRRLRDEEQQREATDRVIQQDRGDMQTLARPITGSILADCPQMLPARETTNGHCSPVSMMERDFSPFGPCASRMPGTEAVRAIWRDCSRS